MQPDGAADPADHDASGSDAGREPGPPPSGSSGTAYLVTPDGGPGPGVLVLHSWWGLSRTTKDVVEALADLGFSALAPDLFDGVVAGDGAEAEELLMALEPNRAAGLILDSVVALRAHTDDPDRPVAVLGFSMGASWALWLATRAPDTVRAVIAYYGLQDTRMEDLGAPLLGHFAEEDPMVSEDDLVFMQSDLLLLGKHVEIHRYPGTRHWFAEQTPAGTGDAEAAELAWRRTVDFLHAHHR
jgi:carboxymethylenebutenolidase